MAGLSAASQLRTAGVAVTLFEERAAYGGRMRREDVAGVMVDPAVQLLGSNYKETFELAKRFGAGDLLVRSPGRDALWRGDRAHAITYGSIASMVTSSALPATLKLRVATKYVPFLNREVGSVDVNDLAHTGGHRFDGQSIGAWGRSAISDDFVELLVYPLLAAYYGAEPEDTSAGLYHSLARTGMDVSVFAVRGGMSRLPERIGEGLIAAGCEVRLGARVSALRSVDGLIEIVADGVSPQQFDRVIVAIPPGDATRLVPSIESWMKGVRMMSTCTLALVTDGPIKADYFGLSVPRGNGALSDVVAFCVEQNKPAGLVPPGQGLLVVMPNPKVAAEMWDATPEQLFERLRPCVARAFPDVLTRIRHARKFGFAEGHTNFYPGYVEHLRRFPQSMLPAGIHLAGDYLMAPNVEGAVRSGRHAASQVLSTLS